MVSTGEPQSDMIFSKWMHAYQNNFRVEFEVCSATDSTLQVFCDTKGAIVRVIEQQDDSPKNDVFTLWWIRGVHYFNPVLSEKSVFRRRDLAADVYKNAVTKAFVFHNSGTHSLVFQSNASPHHVIKVSLRENVLTHDQWKAMHDKTKHFRFMRLPDQYDLIEENDFASAYLVERGVDLKCPPSEEQRWKFLLFVLERTGVLLSDIHASNNWLRDKTRKHFIFVDSTYEANSKVWKWLSDQYGLFKLDFDDEKDAVTRATRILADYIQEKYCDDMVYCHFVVNGDNKIELTNHTARKYATAVSGIREAGLELCSFTAADMGCAEGAIGAMVAQEFVEAEVLLINQDEAECATIEALIENRPRLQVAKKRVQDLETFYKFDVTMWFSVLHHLLASLSPTRVLECVRRHTHVVATIEVPIASDGLLSLWRARVEDPSVYSVLDSVETVIEWLQTKFKRVEYAGKIEYDNSPDLDRHAFICFVR